MANVATKGVETIEFPISCDVQVLNSREYAEQVRQSVSKNGYGTKRSKLRILNERTGRVVTRKTLWKWDGILQAHPDMKDYRRDSYTQQSLWDKGQEWSPHQVWCLEKIAEFMQTKSIFRNSATEAKKKKGKGVIQEAVLEYRYPNIEELNQYLSTHKKDFEFKQFMIEIRRKYHVY